MTEHRKKAAQQWGVDAEALAADYLKKAGYRVLAERLRTPGGEIDILAQEGTDTLVVVEVKARGTFDDGLYAITSAKQKRLRRAVEGLLMWLEEGKLGEIGLANPSSLHIRFDVVVVVPDLPPRHLVNAWQVE